MDYFLSLPITNYWQGHVEIKQLFHEKWGSKKFRKIHNENNCVKVSFLIRFQASACKFINKETLAQAFFENFAKC